MKSYWTVNTICFIKVIIVDGAKRNKGYGKIIIEWSEKFAKQNNCSWLFLDSGYARKEAHLFYQRRGFESTGLSFYKEVL